MELPTIQSIVQAVKDDVPNINRYLFVSVQHLLHTTIDIFQALITLGAKPKNIFLMGKHYSISPTVANKAIQLGIQLQPLTPLQHLGQYKAVFTQDVENMWERVRNYLKNQTDIDTIIILDDGGRCMQMVPKSIAEAFRIVGIEQTTAGICNNERNCNFPYIDVSTSASKSLEADMVAKVILDKIANLLPPTKTKKSRGRISCGIVGLGFIGSAVAKKLDSLGYSLILYDSNIQINKALAVEKRKLLQEDEELECNIIPIRKTLPSIFTSYDTKDSVEKKQFLGLSKAKWVASAEELIQKSDYIFGCTGNDFTKSLDLDNLLKGEKHFISCTSEDKEFLSILKYIYARDNREWNPLGDVHWYRSKYDAIHIVAGGFPCNFDHSGTSVPANDIQLTRALILGALIQAIVIYPSYRRNAIRGRIMLDPMMQKFIVSTWYELTQRKDRLSSKQKDNFQDIYWIIKNSGGMFHKFYEFSDLFMARPKKASPKNVKPKSIVNAMSKTSTVETFKFPRFSELIHVNEQQSVFSIS